MTARRTTHLLWHEPRLFVRKVWQRIKLWRRYAGAARAALPKSRTELASPAEGADIPSLLARTLSVVILERRRNSVVCGVRAVDVPALLASVTENLPQARLLIDGRRPASLGMAALMRESHRATSISVYTPSNADQTLWQFDVYDHIEAGTYVARRRGDAVVSVLYRGVLDRPGVDDLVLRMPELSRRTDRIPIDIVYAWVDSRDPAWRKAFAEATPQDLANGGDAVADGRFHSTTSSATRCARLSLTCLGLRPFTSSRTAARRLGSTPATHGCVG